MSNYGSGDYFSQSDVAGQQLTIMSELFKAVSAMQHIDELLQWLITLIVQRFRIQAAEVWSMQGTNTGYFSMQLRTLVCQDSTLPQHVVANEHLASMADLLVRQRNGFNLQAVNNIFPSYLASLLGRYGLNYCAGHFFSNTALLMPPMSRGASPGSIPTPLTMVMFCFLRQPLPQQTIATAGLTLEQAMTTASSRGLLSATRATPVSGNLPALPLTPSPQEPALPGLMQLVPRHYTDAALMMSSNPLSRSVDISNNQARRLYNAINGRRNVGQLGDATGLELKEIMLALQFLLNERRIELYTSEGQRVDPRQYFQH